MAPTKRLHTDKEPIAKRLKPDPLLQGITSSIEMSTSLPSRTKRLLLKLAPISFMTPADERHALQMSVVQMVGEVIEEVQRVISEELDSRTKSASEVLRARAVLEAAVAESAASKFERDKSVEASKASITHITKTLMDKRMEWELSKVEERHGAEKTAADIKEAESLAAALTAHLEPLVEGTREKPDAAEHLGALMPFIDRLNLDLSLSRALDTSCTKKFSERKQFDGMVVSELEAALRKNLAELKSVVESGCARTSQRAALVSALGREHETWRERQRLAAAEVQQAQRAVHDVDEIMAAAQGAVTKFDAEHAEAMEHITTQRAVLDAFLKWNVACYVVLRDRTTQRSPACLSAKVESSPMEDSIFQDPSTDTL